MIDAKPCSLLLCDSNGPNQWLRPGRTSLSSDQIFPCRLLYNETGAAPCSTSERTQAKGAWHHFQPWKICHSFMSKPFRLYGWKHTFYRWYMHQRNDWKSNEESQTKNRFLRTEAVIKSSGCLRNCRCKIYNFTSAVWDLCGSSVKIKFSAGSQHFRDCKTFMYAG